MVYRISWNDDMNNTANQIFTLISLVSYKTVKQKR